jgi:hypothetical protein
MRMYDPCKYFNPYPFRKMIIGDTFSVEAVRNDGEFKSLFHVTLIIRVRRIA